MSFGDLVPLIVVTGYLDVGPWMSTAPTVAAHAFSPRERRGPIAEAVAARFGAELHEPLDRGRQQWWTDDHPNLERVAPLFRRFEEVYDAGQVTWAGLWTVSTRPTPARRPDRCLGMETGVVSRWPCPSSRPLAVRGAPTGGLDRLVTEHPHALALDDADWDLPGSTEARATWRRCSACRAAAARTSIRRHLVPDWRAVSERYDGVHCRGRVRHLRGLHHRPRRWRRDHAALLVQRADALADRRLRGARAVAGAVAAVRHVSAPT